MVWCQLSVSFVGRRHAGVSGYVRITQTYIDTERIDELWQEPLDCDGWKMMQRRPATFLPRFVMRTIPPTWSHASSILEPPRRLPGHGVFGVLPNIYAVLRGDNLTPRWRVAQIPGRPLRELAPRHAPHAALLDASCATRSSRSPPPHRLTTTARCATRLRRRCATRRCATPGTGPPRGKGGGEKRAGATPSIF